LPGVGEIQEEGRIDERIRVKELKELKEKGIRIVDTRPEPEFGIVNLEGSVSESNLNFVRSGIRPEIFDLSRPDVPFTKFLKNPSLALSPQLNDGSSSNSPTIAFLCRRGNDSLLASRALRRWINENEETPDVRIVDVVGGLTAYAKEEEGFPVY